METTELPRKAKKAAKRITVQWQRNQEGFFRLKGIAYEGRHTKAMKVVARAIRKEYRRERANAVSALYWRLLGEGMI